MRAWLTPERSLTIQGLAAYFKVGAFLPLKAFQRLLGLMLATSSVVPAPHAASAVLAKSQTFIPCLASFQGATPTVLLEAQTSLCHSCDPLVGPLPKSNRFSIGTELQKEGRHDRCLQLGLGSSV